MKKGDIIAMINKGRRGDSISLSEDHGMNKLTDKDVILLSEILKKEYPLITKLSFDDLVFSDQGAVALADLGGLLPLTHFSLQGLHLGDRCIQAFFDALTQRNNELVHESIADFSASSSLSSSSSSSSSQYPTSKLKTLTIGGLKATDVSLHLLEKIIAQTPSLKKCSVNWSNYFTIANAWKLAQTIGTHNISLVEKDMHMFFHSADLYNRRLMFINKFINMIIDRNGKLAMMNKNDSYEFYQKFSQNYNFVLEKNFLITRKIYSLNEFCVNELFFQPLAKDEYQFLLNQQVDILASDDEMYSLENRRDCSKPVLARSFANITDINFSRVTTPDEVKSPSSTHYEVKSPEMIARDVKHIATPPNHHTSVSQSSVTSLLSIKVITMDSPPEHLSSVEQNNPVSPVVSKI
jgi:hypothetical protein